MPEVAGTIPPVKERPKVARRPTIVPKPSVANSTPAASSTAPAPSISAAAKTPASPEKSKISLSKPVQRLAARIAAANGERPKALKPNTATGPQMLSVKERPKVTRQSTILAPAGDAAKPAPKATLALAGKAAAPPAPAPARATEAKPEAAKTFRWSSWLPIAAGIAMSSMAPQLFGLAGHWNPWGQRVLFPLVQLVGLHEIGMSDELTRTLPQLMLYLQFPLEGILVASNFRRGMGPGRAFAPVPGLHFVCALVLWIVSLGVGPLI